MNANGHNMNGSGDNTGVTIMPYHMNGTTALSSVHQGASYALDEVKVFNIVLTSLALCILTLTGLICSISCHKRRRLSMRAHVYESAVIQDVAINPVDIRAVRRSASVRNPLSYFRKQDTSKDNPRIYYIYSNPLPVGLENEENDKSTASRGKRKHEKLTFQDYANDPDNGIILDPPNFYMQL